MRVAVAITLGDEEKNQLPKRQGAHQSHKRVRRRIPKEPTPLRVDSKRKRNPKKSRQTQTTRDDKKVSNTPSPLIYNTPSVTNTPLGIWWTTYSLCNRYENAFGVEEPRWNTRYGHSIPSVVDVPFHGINRRIGGVFAVDENNKLYL